MEDRSTSWRKFYTVHFKLEVVEVAKEKGNREAGRLFPVESWAAVGENCVRNGFIKAQGNAVVPVDNDYAHDDVSSEMEAEQIPNEILNTTDSFILSLMKNLLNLNTLMFNKY
jgi:hypothetical protein